jgi:hypothetical protein
LLIGEFDLRILSLSFALAIAASAAACQSSGTSGTSSPQTAAVDQCSNAKADGARNTPTGQALIKANCQPGGFTSPTYWKEIARQNECVAATGRVCAS